MHRFRSGCAPTKFVHFENPNSGPLTLHMLSKTFSRRHCELFSLFCFQKIDFRNNLHERSKSIVWKKKIEKYDQTTVCWRPSSNCSLSTLILVNTVCWKMSVRIFMVNRTDKIISYKIACAQSNDSDQPAHLRKLIRVIALRSMDSQTFKLTLDADRSFVLNVWKRRLIWVFADRTRSLIGNAVPD